jgi:hypothetical protein
MTEARRRDGLASRAIQTPIRNRVQHTLGLAQRVRRGVEGEKTADAADDGTSLFENSLKTSGCLQRDSMTD